MPDKSSYSPANVGMSVAGGIASALVFAVLSKGAFAGFLLAHFAPLPLMIVALGLGVGHGATAAIVATLFLSVWPHWLFGMAYGLLVALPAWLSCWVLAGAPFGRRDRLVPGLPGWAVAALCLSIVGAILFFLGVTQLSHGRIEEPLAYIQQQFDLALAAMKADDKLGDDLNTEDLKGFARMFLPATLASYLVMTQALDLWIAGRLTQFSGMLKQPWPDIAASFALPRPLAGLFLAAAALSMIGGVGGAAALAVAAPLGLAFGLQGLAVTHYWLRGSRSSLLVLTILYFCLGLLGAPMILFSLLGTADVFLRLRQKKSVGPKPNEAV